jgi:pimeloyl-ACP methyl ester carboxylesterase
MDKSQRCAGYFHNGLPYNRLGHGPRILVISQGLAFENKHDFQDRLAEIRAPTLVIAGARDPFYTEALLRETAAGIPNARLILYP